MDSWPNQEALNKALNIYRTYMRSFIIFHLKKIKGRNVEDIVVDSLDDAGQSNRADEIERMLDQADRDIKSIIDIDDFPRLVNASWKDSFKIPLNDDKTFRNQLWLIKDGRDQSWAHPPEGDAESEGTRAYLFLIADVLSKIKKPNKQREVEVIRDKLFPDVTKECLAEAEERLKDVEAENAEYQKSLAEVERNLETERSEKIKYEKDNATLSKQIDEKEKRLKKLSKQLKSARTANDKYKKNLSGTKQRLEKSEVAQADYKERLKTTSKELKDTKNELSSVEMEKTDHKKQLKTISEELESVKVEKNASEKCLAVTQNVLTTVAIGDQAIFPPLGINAAVRVLDRRGTDKRNYLLRLLEQKQPTIVYVQSEEKIDQLLTLVGPEKAEVIGKHDHQISEAEETEILEKLESGELIAVVSNTTFSMLTPLGCVEHFVFCHLVPGLDKFFEQCEPAFRLAKNAYLHLIYESKQNVEELAKKYPNEEGLRKLYQRFRDCTLMNTEFINPDNLYSELCKESELDITKLGIETGFSIFEELGFLEQNEEGIRRVSTTPTKLEESKIYCRGEKLKKEVANSPAFQYEHSIEQIWEGILEKLNVDSEQILRESDIHSKHFKISEKDSDMQPIAETEQDRPTPDIWPQRSLSSFDALRQRAAKIADDTDSVLIREDDGRVNSPYRNMENQEAYENKYDLAMQFAQEHGVSALEQGVTELIKDQNDSDYDFTEDETNMLRAFQDVLKDFGTQFEQFTEAVESDSTMDNETLEASPTPKPSRANAKVTEEQVPLREIRGEVAKSTKTKSRKKKPSIAERYVEETTVEDRDGIAAKVVELRINATGSRPLAWREIREKLGLENDQFHKVVRPSEGYRKAVIQRIKSLKAQEGGWEYNGKLEVLTGIELTEKELE